MNDAPVRFTIKDVISLGTIAGLVAVQWGVNSMRVASAEERLNKIEISDKEQTKDGSDVRVKLTAIEKDTSQLRKDMDEQKQLLNKVLEELRNQKK